VGTRCHFAICSQQKTSFLSFLVRETGIPPDETGQPTVETRGWQVDGHNKGHDLRAREVTCSPPSSPALHLMVNYCLLSSKPRVRFVG
jgi:hypothetical protein